MTATREERANASAAGSGERGACLDVARVRADFPQLEVRMRGRPLAYLDSAASALKPRAVIDRVSRFYATEYANVHRGVYALSEAATAMYEASRAAVRRFLHAADDREVVFCRGATEAINLVAASFVRPGLQAGDEVLVSAIEHHANIVPWQLICAERGARLRVIPVDDRGDLQLDEAERLLGPRTKILAVGEVSNALGTVNPVAELVALAHARGVPVLVDGAQAVLHGPVDVGALGCDFYVFSGHKALGPTGIGCLWGRLELLEGMPPYQGGGDMIRSVRFEGTTFADPPLRFEAGTPHIAGAIGLAEALGYLERADRDAIARHEHALLARAIALLEDIPGLRLIGTPRRRAGVISFVVDDVHPHDLGAVLDAGGVAIRAGHHCAQPVMERFSVPATARASVALYNTADDVDRLAAGVREAVRMFRG